MKLLSGVGFSNGCAALALMKPPPLVPSILIAICDATGPCPMDVSRRCPAAAPLWSTAFTLVYGLKFWIIPWRHQERCVHDADRKQQVKLKPHQIHPEIADRFGSGLRAIPRTRAAAMAIPTAGREKVVDASATICEKYDMVFSPP